MAMLISVIGLVICLWAISSGFGAPTLGRTTVFAGLLGFILNIIVLLIGVGLIILGFELQGFDLLSLFFSPHAPD